MEEPRLPHNPKEGILFGATITAISCLIIGGANIFLEVGAEKFVISLASSYIFIFIFAFILSSAFVEKVARKVVGHFYVPGDSINSMLCYNLIVFVLLMSSIMSILGPIAGQTAAYLFEGQAYDFEYIFTNWINIWPRNFCIAFWVEMLIAQPTARRLMVYIHSKQ